MSKTSTPRNRMEALSQDEQMLAGVQQNLSALASLTVGSQTMTPAQIVQSIQGRITTAKAAQTARAAQIAAAKADRDMRTQTQPLMSALRRIVIGMYMESPDTLDTFGLKPPKAATMSTEERAAAAAKGVATRKANHPKAAPSPAPSAAPLGATATTKPAA